MVVLVKTMNMDSLVDQNIVKIMMFSKLATDAWNRRQPVLPEDQVHTRVMPTWEVNRYVMMTGLRKMPMYFVNRWDSAEQESQGMGHTLEMYRDHFLLSFLVSQEQQTLNV